MTQTPIDTDADMQRADEPELPDIIVRINDACVGYPFARIPWPHRLLHDARAEIDRLRALAGETVEI